MRNRIRKVLLLDVGLSGAAAFAVMFAGFALCVLGFVVYGIAQVVAMPLMESGALGMHEVVVGVVCLNGLAFSIAVACHVGPYAKQLAEKL